MGDQPLWRDCMSCRRKFCVGETKESAELHPKGARNFPFCGSDRVVGGYVADPPNVIHWR